MFLVIFHQTYTGTQRKKKRNVQTKKTTVRSDVEERVAEERLAWNDKNIPAWPKNISVL